MGTDHIHRVCTYTEAGNAIRAHDEHYVSDCFCRGPAREGSSPWNYCGHEVHNCMGFSEPVTEGIPWSRISLDEALGKFEQWKKEGNFFRFMEDDDWICFCCGCGCGFFRDEEGTKVTDTCDPSPCIEKTDQDACSLCGDCVKVCAFDARSVVTGSINVESERCQGCSACESVCPGDAIAMIQR